MIDQLIEQMEKVCPLSDGCKTHMRHVFQERRIPKRGYILRIGDISRHMSFVIQGLVRGFTSVNGRVITMRFVGVGGLCIVPSSFYTQSPSDEALKALVDSVLLEVELSQMQDTCRKFPEFSVLMTNILIHEYLQMEDILWTIRALTPEERYRRFVDACSDDQKPFYQYVSSFLGITERQLARFRRTKK